MEAAKTFERNGVRYRPGDALPSDIDKATLEHYKRYGMVREAKPSETKPVAPRRRAAPESKNVKPAAPASSVEGSHIQLDQVTMTTSQDVGTESKQPTDAPVADAPSADHSADTAAPAAPPEA